MGAVIGTYEVAVQWLEDASDELTMLFEERPLNKPELHAFRLRSARQLRRLTDPMHCDDRHRREPTSGPEDETGRDTAIGRHRVMLSEQHARVPHGHALAGGTVIGLRHQPCAGRCAAEPD